MKRSKIPKPYLRTIREHFGQHRYLELVSSLPLRVARYIPNLRKASRNTKLNSRKKTTPKHPRLHFHIWHSENVKNKRNLTVFAQLHWRCAVIPANRRPGESPDRKSGRRLEASLWGHRTNSNRAWNRGRASSRRTEEKEVGKKNRRRRWKTWERM